MPDPKCIYAHIDGLASMDLPEGHAPEVLCTLTDIGGMVCTGEVGCRFFATRPDMLALNEAIARYLVEHFFGICPDDQWGIPTRKPCWTFYTEDAAGLFDVIRAAGYDIVPQEK